MGKLLVQARKGRQRREKKARNKRMKGERVEERERVRKIRKWSLPPIGRLVTGGESFMGSTTTKSKDYHL